MEEVDNIILHFLRQLNVDISEDIKGLADLSPTIIIEAVSKCLNTINPALKAPQSLPPGISHKIEIAAQVAAICKDLGYKSEVGYQTFLYHHEGDLRKVFMFLIECLPDEKEKPTSPAKQEDSCSVLWQRIKSKITEELEIVWIPHCCKPQSNGFQSMENKDRKDNTSNINTSYLPNEAYVLELLKKMKEKEQSETQKSEQSINKEENKVVVDKVETSKIELKELKEEARTLRDKLHTLTIEKNSIESELLQVRKTNEKLDTDIQQFKNIHSLITDLDISLEEGIDKVIAKIQTDLSRLHIKSDNCTQKNLSLKADIANLKHELSQSNSERNRRLRTLEELKSTARELKEEYKHKEQSNAQLRKEYERINRSGMKRSVYTKKIMEIINNVAKQKIEIHKILGDTRQLQKEINSLNGQLDRSFSIADETLFRDAKKDDQSKKAYKLLALLHSECNTIVSLVNDTGALSRDIVDLEDHIEVEKSKRTEEILQRIQQDLKQIQMEVETVMSTNN